MIQGVLRAAACSKSTVGAMALICALSVAPATATNITLVGVGTGLVVPLIADGAPENGWAGEINITMYGQPVTLFCVDLFTAIDYGTYGSTITNAAPQYQRAAWLFTQYFVQGAMTNDKAAALQLAIWDVVHDSGDGLSAGRVILDAGGPDPVRTLASTYISNSYGQSATNVSIFHNVTVGSGLPAQTLMGSAMLPTPEPSAYASIGLGLLGILACTKRRARGK